MQKNIGFARGYIHPVLKRKSHINWLYIMRIAVFCSALLIFSSSLIAAVPSMGQSITKTNISIHLKHESLKSALLKIQQQSGFNIFYPSAKVAEITNVNVAGKTMSIAGLLDLLLEGTGLGFVQDGNKIILSEIKTSAATGDAAATRILGIVVDANGAPLPGVSVMLKKSRTVSTATDENGHFHIEVDGPSDELVFSYIGYKTQVIPVGTSINMRVVLLANDNSLEGVVVIGYGTSSRKDLTGSVSRVTAKTIQEQPVGNVMNALQGRMAGVEVSQSNGLPGSGVSIKIRGQASINSGTQPLYIIDGVPFNFSLNVFTTGANGTVEPLNSLNPADIESIDVLKDGDATAIYGARGGNGVILITTKKGMAGKTKLNINLNSGLGSVGNKIDMLSGEQYLALRKEAFANDNVVPTAGNAPDLVSWSQTKFTDWQEELIGGTSHYNDFQASLSGGNEGTHFLFSPSYHRETTVYPGDFAQNRISARLNVDHTSKDKKFYALISAAYSYDRNNLPRLDPSTYFALAPNYEPYTATGAFNQSGLVQYNPFAVLGQTYKASTANLIGNMNLRYQILPGLSVKANLGYTSLYFDQNVQKPGATLNPAFETAISNAVFGTTQAKSYIAEPQLEYIRELGKGKLTALAGTTFQSSTSSTNTVTGTNYSNDALLGSMAAAGTLSAGTGYDNYDFTSLFGRVTYNWAGKYIINGTIRRDGSSRFGENNRFGTFGAVGAAWVFSEEEFVKKAVPFLSFGKLRGSYGVTGNDQIANYQYLSTYTASGSTGGYQGITVQNPSRLANPDVQWESNKKAEIALDLGFLNDRILFTAAAFRNLSGNQLLYISTPGQVGFTSYLGNFPATIRSQGLELELNTRNIENKAFKWSTSFNFTLSKTTITKFDNLANLSFYANSFLVGYQVPLSRQYIFNGINPDNGQITYQTANANGTPSFLVDQQPNDIGNPFYGGITNTFNYKQFEFGFFFQFKHQYGYINGVNGPNSSLGSLNNQNITTLDRWTAPGQVTQFGAATTSSTNPAFNRYSFYYNSSTAFYGDASWLKLKNVNLAYNFPAEWLPKAGLSGLKVYAQAQNILTFSRYKNSYDPETGTGMPALRMVVLGLNASF
jgi:TonB-linked SusC/RagA family outer membrane protein